MNENALQQILEEIEAAWRDPISESKEKYWSKMHSLAEAQYLPAVDFFLRCLDDTRADWREDCLTCLGFHYEFSADSKIAEKIRQLLLADPDGFVRLAAASVLGSRSKSTDPALITAVQADLDEDVRYAAFDALLTLAGVPAPMVRNEVERAKKGEIQPTIEELERIRREHLGDEG